MGWPSVACGGSALVLYLASASPLAGSGDLAEFQTLAATGGVAHSGYPLFVMALQALGALPLGTVAWRAAAVCALAGALAVALAAWYGAQVSGRAGVGVGVGASLALTTSMWREASRPEIYAFTLLITVGIFLAARAYLRRPSARGAAVTGLLAGLGLVSHLGVLGLITPLCAIAAWRLLRGQTTVRHLLAAALGLAIGLLPLVYLLQQDRSPAPMNYLGDTFGPMPPDASPSEHVVRVVRLLSARQYFEGAGVAFRPFSDTPGRLRTLFDDLTLNGTSIAGVFLGLWGLVVVLRRSTSEGLLLGGWIASQLFWLSLAAYHDTVVSFFLPALWALTALQAHGLAGLGRLRRPAATVAAGLLVAVPLTRLALIEPPPFIAHHPMLEAAWREGPRAILDERRDSTWQAYGAGVLRTLEPGAVVFACWEEGTALRYLRFAESQRPDVEIRWRCNDAERLRSDVAEAATHGHPMYVTYDPTGLLDPRAKVEPAGRWGRETLWRIRP